MLMRFPIAREAAGEMNEGSFILFTAKTRSVICPCTETLGAEDLKGDGLVNLVERFLGIIPALELWHR